jgi:protein-disulfide isomerase
VFRSRSFLGKLLVCGIVAASSAGCRAQGTSPDPQVAPQLDPQLARRIEVQVRSQLQVPSDYAVSVGPRTASSFPGYDTVSLTFSLPSNPAAKPKIVDFLLSKDGASLARLQTFDLTKDPANVAQLASRPVRGSETAKVTIVNFDDLECPYCAKMHKELFPETFEHYKGLVKIVYKDDPLVEIHPWAMHASVDANCLADQSGAAYWSFVDYVHAHGDEISGPDRDTAKAGQTLDRIALDQGSREKVDAAALSACIKKQDNGAVLASMKEADGLKIDGTPTLFINGERISGALPIEQVWAVIDRALAAEGQKPPASSTSPAGANPPKSPTGN